MNPRSRRIQAICLLVLLYLIPYCMNFLYDNELVISGDGGKLSARIWNMCPPAQSKIDGKHVYYTCDGSGEFCGRVGPFAMQGDADAYAEIIEKTSFLCEALDVVDHTPNRATLKADMGNIDFWGQLVYLSAGVLMMSLLFIIFELEFSTPDARHARENVRHAVFLSGVALMFFVSVTATYIGVSNEETPEALKCAYILGVPRFVGMVSVGGNSIDCQYPSDSPAIVTQYVHNTRPYVSGASSLTFESGYSACEYVARMSSNHVPLAVQQGSVVGSCPIAVPGYSGLMLTALICCVISIFVAFMHKWIRESLI